MKSFCKNTRRPKAEELEQRLSEEKQGENSKASVYFFYIVWKRCA
jgi:hypothetical protein